MSARFMRMCRILMRCRRAVGQAVTRRLRDRAASSRRVAARPARLLLACAHVRTSDGSGGRALQARLRVGVQRDTVLWETCGHLRPHSSVVGLPAVGAACARAVAARAGRPCCGGALGMHGGRWRARRAVSVSIRCVLAPLQEQPWLLNTNQIRSRSQNMFDWADRRLNFVSGVLCQETITVQQ